MKLVCEVIALDIMPAFRALIAKNLVEGYGMSQREVARRLGLTQPAISQYKKQSRGRKVAILMELGIDKSAMAIAKGIHEGLEQEKINRLFSESCGRIKKHFKDCVQCDACAP